MNTIKMLLEKASHGNVILIETGQDRLAELVDLLVRLNCLWLGASCPTSEVIDAYAKEQISGIKILSETTFVFNESRIINASEVYSIEDILPDKTIDHSNILLLMEGC